MKSSPKSSEIPPSTESKTPASSKKLVQARLPFKTLGGSEPPLSIEIETSETVLANTLTPVTDNRKRKQITDDDDIRSAKLNRCENDITFEEVNESAVNKPKARQSLEFLPRKSKRTSDGLITIKLPKIAKKNKKIHSGTNNDVQVETNKQELEANVNSKETPPIEEKVSVEQDDSSDDDENENPDTKILEDSVVSNVSDQCSTPNNHRLTPKQLQKRLESEKKKQEKEMARLERERKLQEEKELRQREKEERELQKKREREEKGTYIQNSIFYLIFQFDQRRVIV